MTTADITIMLLDPLKPEGPHKLRITIYESTGRDGSGKRIVHRAGATSPDRQPLVDRAGAALRGLFAVGITDVHMSPGDLALEVEGPADAAISQLGEGDEYPPLKVRA